MSSDIKLSDDRVIIEGNYLESHTADIILDHPPRRRPDANPQVPRRAIVHGFNDELVVNFHSDYPGGVVIQGEVKILDQLLLGQPEAAREAHAPESNNMTRADGLGNLAPGLEEVRRLEHDRLFETIAQSVSPIDLAVELRHLRQAVVILYARLKQMEASTR